MKTFKEYIENYIFLESTPTREIIKGLKKTIREMEIDGMPSATVGEIASDKTDDEVEEQNLQEFNWGKMLGTAGLTAGLGLGLLNKNDIPKQINKKNNIIKNDDKKVKKEIKKEDNSISTDEFMRFIEPHEGRRNKSYKDTRGFKTVGVGLNLDAPGARQRIQSVGANFNRIYSGSDVLSDEQIDILFRQDVERHLEIARRQFPNLNEMPRNVQLVIVDMIFNLGSLTNFPRLRDALNSGNWAQAANEMEGSRWYRQVGNRSRELVNLMRSVRLL